MSDSTQRRTAQRGRNAPAVGLVAAPEESETLVTTVLRAHREGLDTFVHANGAAGSEAVELAKYAGATIIEGGPVGEGVDPEVHLRSQARREGYPGLIYSPESDQEIDLERSRAALTADDDYVIEAETRSAVASTTRRLVAIPSFNEAATIADVVAEAGAHADEVLVIDDGSTDHTAERARAAGATVYAHDFNRGYGAGLKSAFEQAAAANVDQLVIIDGDAQHEPDDIERLVRTQSETGADIVIGSRFRKGAKTDVPLYRRFGIAVVNLLTNISLGAVRKRNRLSDTQSGFRVYNRRAIESLANDDSIGDGMAASTDIIHHAHTRNFDVEEVGTTVSYDVENGSHLNPMSHGLHLVSNLLRTIEHEQPILILGVPGFVMTLVGLGFGYLTFVNYLSSGVFPLGLALTSGMLGLAGIFAGFTAIILHALNTQRA